MGSRQKTIKSSPLYLRGNWVGSNNRGQQEIIDQALAFAMANRCWKQIAGEKLMRVVPPQHPKLQHILAKNRP